MPVNEGETISRAWVMGPVLLLSFVLSGGVGFVGAKPPPLCIEDMAEAEAQVSVTVCLWARHRA